MIIVFVFYTVCSNSTVGAHLSRTFKKLIGVSFGDLLNSFNLNLACNSVPFNECEMFNEMSRSFHGLFHLKNMCTCLQHFFLNVVVSRCFQWRKEWNYRKVLSSYVRSSRPFVRWQNGIKIGDMEPGQVGRNIQIQGSIQPW